MSENLIGGRYRLTQQIGSKDGARTYKAVDDSGVATAVEMIWADAPEHVAQLDQWASRVAALEHPDLCRVYGFGHDGNTYYLAREYVDGFNLKTLVAGGPLKPITAARYGAQMCGALSVAHQYGIIHGDLRPHNIMISRDGSVKVTEFAMPNATGGPTFRKDPAPEAWHYVSPEEAAGEPLMRESDIYSVGVMLYEMATGTVPFDGSTAAEVRDKHQHEVPMPPESVNVNVPPGLTGIIMRALGKCPADRYRSVDEMRWDLTALITSLEAPLALTPDEQPALLDAAAPRRGASRWQ